MFTASSSIENGPLIIKSWASYLPESVSIKMKLNCTIYGHVSGDIETPFWGKPEVSVSKTKTNILSCAELYRV